ncbi:Uncharacterised protein [uncultured archaeon]|nr:Uncharacterised protein [uncultured archaeon]
MNSHLAANTKSKKSFGGSKASPILSRALAEKLRREASKGNASFEERLVAAEKKFGTGQIPAQTLQLFVNRHFGNGSFERAKNHLIQNTNFPIRPPYSRENLLQIIKWLEDVNGSKK